MKKYWSENTSNVTMPWKFYQHLLVVGDGFLDCTNNLGSLNTNLKTALLERSMIHASLTEDLTKYVAKEHNLLEVKSKAS